MKIRCRTDIQLFAEYYFPDLTRLPWTTLHRYLFRRRIAKTSEQPPARRGSIDCVVAPRGAAKSTLISLIFPIHALLYRSDHYILVISATHRQALARLANIRDALDDNERIAEAFGPELSRWGKRSESSIAVNRVKIDAFSAGSELRGLGYGRWRPTWIILDDVESSARVLRSDYRETLADWMKEVIENLGNGYTNIDLIGTLLHTDALPARLALRPDVTAETFRSITSEADDNALWEQWRAIVFDLSNPRRLAEGREFFAARKDRMLKGASVLWPEKESYYDLRLMREVRGRTAFDKEKQNLPPAGGASMFNVSKLRRFRLESDRLLLDPNALRPSSNDSPQVDLSSLRTFGFLDPALGESSGAGSGARSDFAAIATVGIDPQGYIYTLDVWLAREGPSAQIEKIFELHERWNYAGFGVETNAFQKILLDPIEQERDRRRAAGSPWDVPVRGVHHRANKVARIGGLEAIIASGWVLFNRNLDAEFLAQLSDFPLGRHDDGPDALEAAITLARNTNRKPELHSITRAQSKGGPRSY